MNQNRKAGLQRRLSMAPVAKPPLNLADRIKADIPADLGREQSRFRFNSATLRVAASLLLVIGSLYFAVRVISRGERPSIIAAHKNATSAADAARERSAEAAKRVLNVEEPSAPPVAVAETSQVASAPIRAAAPTVHPTVAKQTAAETRRDAEAIVADKAPAGTAGLEAPLEAPPIAAVTGGMTTGAPAEDARESAPVIQRADRMTITASAPAITAAQAPGPEDARRGNAARSEAAAQKTVATPPALLGVSIDPDAVERIKQAIESGVLPAASTVDVDAVVSAYRAYPATPSTLASLNVEASRPPVAADSRTVLLRISVDTPEGIGNAARDVRLNVTFSRSAVVSVRRVGHPAQRLMMSETALPARTSVTLLFELKLAADAAADATLASIQLTQLPTDRSDVARREVRVHEASREWSAASARQRIVTLAGFWAERLHDGKPLDDLVVSAERLASELPGNAAASELARLVTASSRLQSSGRTGNER